MRPVCSDPTGHAHSTLRVAVAGGPTDTYVACHSTRCTCTPCRMARSTETNPLGALR